ncbi:arginine-hydroxylase NDUFAF5, mitochondrial-like [Dysidea avara]|uniref:arginine-hydroxylase NDUFAF5, mitochondrial-like n=1 Tax=Dysidea avara TaxID=196820 RepID=UPI00331A6137
MRVKMNVTTRLYATSLQRIVLTRPSSSVTNIFDREAKRKQRNRAGGARDAEVYDYLKDQIAANICDRLSDIKRDFPLVLDVGCGRGHINKTIDKEIVGKVFQCDPAANMLLGQVTSCDPSYRVIADCEFLPFEDDKFNLVTSNLSLHWHNDLPAAIKEVLRVLKPDGVFLGAMFSGDTLYELRCSLQLAELERNGGFSPRVSPFVEMRDAGGLLTGFSLTTIDVDDIIVNYPDMISLMYDLKGMGENSSTTHRAHMIPNDVITAASAIYKEIYGDNDGTIPATFQILYLIGWKPDQSQAKPKPRGTATVSLKDLDNYLKR